MDAQSFIYVLSTDVLAKGIHTHAHLQRNANANFIVTAQVLIIITQITVMVALLLNVQSEGFYISNVMPCSCSSLTSASEADEVIAMTCPLLMRATKRKCN